MANTTNYNWATPDNTDLVKDGAAAIRTLGNSIDTTTKALNPETTLGDIAYRSSTSNTNTRLPIGSNGQILGVSAGVPAWINNDQGDITEVQAGTGISVASGTGPIPVVTNTVATAYDAKGDLIVGTGADTFSKLSVGTNGYTLVADSSQTTGLAWAAPASGSSFVGCALYDTNSTQSIASGTDTVITFDSEDFDTDGFHSTSSNTGRITIPSGKAGKYLFVAQGFFNNQTGNKEGRLYKNGTQITTAGVSGTQTGVASVYLDYIISLSVGDYVEFRVVQNTGGSTSFYKSGGGSLNYAWFHCQYLGA